MARSAASTRRGFVAGVLASSALASAVTAKTVTAIAERPVVAAAGPRMVATHRPGAAIPWTTAGTRVYAEVERRARKLTPATRTRVARTILEEAAAASMNPLLVVAVIHVESSFDASAASSAGALGLMQLLDGTMREEAARSGLASVDARDPVANVRAGVRYLRRLQRRFDDLELALVAYNAGPGRTLRHLRSGGIPQRLLGYPRGVLRLLGELSAQAGEGGAGPSTGRGVAAPSARRRPDALVAAHRGGVAGWLVLARAEHAAQRAATLAWREPTRSDDRARSAPPAVAWARAARRGEPDRESGRSRGHRRARGRPVTGRARRCAAGSRAAGAARPRQAAP
jgi:hypothetical protein